MERGREGIRELTLVGLGYPDAAFDEYPDGFRVTERNAQSQRGVAFFVRRFQVDPLSGREIWQFGLLRDLFHSERRRVDREPVYVRVVELSRGQGEPPRIRRVLLTRELGVGRD